MRKFLAYPAYLSSKVAAHFCPRLVEDSGWNGEFDLSYMYRRGYIFGAVTWAIAIGGLVILAI